MSASLGLPPGGLHHLLVGHGVDVVSFIELHLVVLRKVELGLVHLFLFVPAVLCRRRHDS